MNCSSISYDAVMNRPRISVIVPVYNGAEHIEDCVSSILSQDYPTDKLEIFIVDGCSTDGTRNIIRKIKDDNPTLIVLDNPAKVKPAALNLAIRHSSGQFICIVDALSCLEPDYISTCAEVANSLGAENVGGAARPKSGTFTGKAAGLARLCRFGLGGGRYNNPDYEGYADTVYLGFYRREVFAKAGLFDEAIVRGQDIEMNCRLRRAGGKIYMCPRIKSHYHTRDSLLALATRMFRTGMWNVKKVQRNPDAFAPRHWVPFCFVTTMIALALLTLIWKPSLYIAGGILSLYLVANLIAATLLAAQKGLKYLPLLPLVFAIMHFCYGLGTISGFLRFGVPVRVLTKGAWRKMWSKQN